MPIIFEEAVAGAGLGMVSAAPAPAAIFRNSRRFTSNPMDKSFFPSWQRILLLAGFAHGTCAPSVPTYTAYSDWLAAMNSRFFFAPPKHRFAHVSGRWI